MDITTAEPGVPAPRSTRSRPLRIALAIAVVAVVVGALAYGVGQDARGPHVLHGTAYVGASQATVIVDGWGYGMGRDVNWIDSAGSMQDSGWPPCFVSGHRARITFAEVTVDAPNQNSWREVVWVRCDS